MATKTGSVCMHWISSYALSLARGVSYRSGHVILCCDSPSTKPISALVSGVECGLTHHQGCPIQPYRPDNSEAARLNAASGDNGSGMPMLLQQRMHLWRAEQCLRVAHGHDD